MSLVIKTSLCQRAASLTFYQHRKFFCAYKLICTFRCRKFASTKIFKIFRSLRGEVLFCYFPFRVFFPVPDAFFRYKMRPVLSSQFFLQNSKKGFTIVVNEKKVLPRDFRLFPSFILFRLFQNKLHQNSQSQVLA